MGENEWHTPFEEGDWESDRKQLGLRFVFLPKQIAQHIAHVFHSHFPENLIKSTEFKMYNTDVYCVLKRIKI